MIQDTTIKDIDLSVLLKLPCKLIPGELVELKMIEFYKFYQTDTDNIYTHFTKYLLARKMGDNLDRKPVEIFNFYRPNYYNNVILDFNNKLDCIVILKTGEHNFNNIVFDSILSKTESELLARFKIFK